MTGPANSFEATAAVMKGCTLSGTPKLVLLGIAMHTGPGGSWPSLDTLAGYANVHPRNAQRALDRLVADGWVVRVIGGGGGGGHTRADRRPNRYEIRWQRVYGVSDATPRPAYGVAEAPPRQGLRGGAGAVYGVAHAPPEQTLEQTQTKERRDSSEVATTAEGDNGADPRVGDSVRDIFDTWIEATGRTGRTRLDDKRRRRIVKALHDYPVDEVRDAVRGWAHDPWTHRVRNNDVELLLRNSANLEKFRDMWRNHQPTQQGVARAPDPDCSVCTGTGWKETDLGAVPCDCVSTPR